MSEHKNNVFFLVIDDGGHRFLPDNKTEIPFSAYLSILRLAQEFEIKIPIGVTMKYLDINNVSGASSPISYSEKLINLIKSNKNYFELADHGFSHRLNGTGSEYFDPRKSIRVSKKEHEEKICKNLLIYKDLGFSFPEIFIPPSNFWEEGVTDRLYSKYGAKYLIGCRHCWHDINQSKVNFIINYLSPIYSWKDSDYLLFLPRIGCGLGGDDVELGCRLFKKIKRRIFPNVLFDASKNRIFFKSSYHSYMAHIGNFMGSSSFDWWFKVFKMCKEDRRVYFAKDNVDAVMFYQNKKRYKF